MLTSVKPCLLSASGTDVAATPAAGTSPSMPMGVPGSCWYLAHTAEKPAWMLSTGVPPPWGKSGGRIIKGRQGEQGHKGQRRNAGV